MEVQVISKTVQKFDGESFYLCGLYYQRKGKRLHRSVWEYHNGTIPKGYHVHHKDGNRANNDISNLALMHGSDHLSEHMSKEERKALSRERVSIAIAEAPKWHRSKEGKEWHSKHGKDTWKKRTTQTYTCTYCGKDYQTKHIYPKDSNHFCHNNCRAAYRRQQIRNGEIEK